MAGIKHGMWGYPPSESNKGPRNQEEWYKEVISNQKQFCKLCGGQIIPADQDEHGRSVNWVWEMQNEMHGQCYMDQVTRMRGQHGSNS